MFDVSAIAAIEDRDGAGQGRALETSCRCIREQPLSRRFAGTACGHTANHGPSDTQRDHIPACRRFAAMPARLDIGVLASPCPRATAIPDPRDRRDLQAALPRGDARSAVSGQCHWLRAGRRRPRCSRTVVLTRRGQPGCRPTRPCSPDRLSNTDRHAMPGRMGHDPQQRQRGGNAGTGRWRRPNRTSRFLLPRTPRGYPSGADAA
jgi:hypothetical protein